MGYFSRSPVSQLADVTGCYAAQGIQVHEVAVESSPAQFRALLAGELDIVLTSPDNVMTYRVNESNPLQARADVRIIRAVDSGLGLSLLTGAGIDDPSALRGQPIGVDVPTSGFAYALYTLLERWDLLPGTGYRVVALGSTPRRAQALIRGGCAATLLNAGHDVIAELAQCRRVVRVVDALGPYLGAVLAASGPWLDANGELVRDFLRAWDEAAARVLDPAWDGRLRALLTDEELTEDGVEAVLDTWRSPAEGTRRDPRVPLDALSTVIELRASAGGFEHGVDLGALRSGGLGLLDARFCGTAAS